MGLFIEYCHESPLLYQSTIELQPRVTITRTNETKAHIETCPLVVVPLVRVTEPFAVPLVVPLGVECSRRLATAATRAAPRPLPSSATSIWNCNGHDMLTIQLPIQPHRSLLVIPTSFSRYFLFVYLQRNGPRGTVDKCFSPEFSFPLIRIANILSM